MNSLNVYSSLGIERVNKCNIITMIQSELLRANVKCAPNEQILLQLMTLDNQIFPTKRVVSYYKLTINFLLDL